MANTLNLPVGIENFVSAQYYFIGLKIIAMLL